MKGPLGFWHFPLLSFIASKLTTHKGITNGARVLPALAPPPTVVNSEQITWTDWKGRKRDMTIHREVKEK